MKIRRAAVATVSTVAALGVVSLSATAADAAPARPANSAHSPYKVKSMHKVGKSWAVETTSILKNANAACNKADHLFYKKPKKGYVYVVVQFTGKKLTGGKKQNLGDGIITNLRAKDGKQYGQDYGIVAPHDAANSKAVGKNHKTSGGFVYMVKKSDVKAGHLEAMVEGTGVHDETIYFFNT
ncbi:hypothetical protein [Jatrophihabitans endophyticus]|uniref:hypothetical protein n=1 Tax=Jatrophihabitans endophyticus TaxID=1206085 RepID=UPI0019ECE443|nr:hypothetical protein [Jatrophihabitans endophyticus]MBE7187235.1 hypothetical protein [Jatrophihabitans endophyticus]